jgi:hypothetical protein
MPAKPGGYSDVLAIESGPGWTHPEGDPEGVSEFILNRHADGSYTHLLRVKKGTVFPEPVLHEFYEEAYYVHGEMLNTKTKRRSRTEPTSSTSPARSTGLSGASKPA